MSQLSLVLIALCSLASHSEGVLSSANSTAHSSQGASNKATSSNPSSSELWTGILIITLAASLVLFFIAVLVHYRLIRKLPEAST